MPHRALLALIAWAACLQGALAAPDLQEAARHIVDETNTLRRQQQLGALTPQRQLDEAAQTFAEHMARTDRYGHQADGREPSQRVRAQGYDYCLVAENIAYRYSSQGFATRELAQGFVQGWRHSPPHWRNILTPDAVETGVAVARSARSGRYYAVQMFGRPKTMSVTFRIANRTPATVSYELDGQTHHLPPRTTDTHQQCSTPRLLVQLPGADAAAVAPRDGELYAVERNGARYVLKRS